MYHRPRLIPCLLLSDGGLVKTVRFKDPNYLGDPINAVKIFSEKCVDELCVQDIQASREGRGPDFALLEDLASEAFMPLSYGGGVTTVEQAARLFHIGFEKVILNTALIDRPELVRELADRFGSQSVVASIDVRLDRLRRYRCVVAGGTRLTGETPLALAQRAQALGAGEVLLNSVDRDGMMQGYDLKLVRSVADGLSVPLIACGGARDAADLGRVLHEGHAHAAAAGSLFVYFGPLKAVLINVPSEEELCRLGVYQPR